MKTKFKRYYWPRPEQFIKRLDLNFTTDLDLIDVDVLELFLHLFGAHLHGGHRRLRVLQGLSSVVRLLHVERLKKTSQIIEALFA